MVKSKWGLAFSAVVTVVCSLLMSVSICLFFGLTPSLNGRCVLNVVNAGVCIHATLWVDKNKVVVCYVFVFSEIFPYLVVIIGLENVLVVTKSVVSTPVHLEVKLRVAQGQRQLMFFFVVCKNYYLIFFTFSLFNFLIIMIVLTTCICTYRHKQGGLVHIQEPCHWAADIGYRLLDVCTCHSGEQKLSDVVAWWLATYTWLPV